ncbi:hypothetical protein [Amycolatopsis minnesotensis]|uniref:Uncharacterized protein n=1 Tax=Amycolatopsis minnesotensis TaxID=337894 RepID=A0ABN2RKI8_9PSEU
MSTSEPSPPGAAFSVLYIGQSPDLACLEHWATSHGITAATGPPGDGDSGLLCAVADSDVLDGHGTGSQRALLQRARDLQIPCLTLDQAWSLAASAVGRQRTAA